MLALAGLTFAYTSCTDYSEDINANKDRIDNLKTEVDGKLADLSQQLSNVNKTIDDLKAADAAAGKSIEALQKSADALKEQLTALEKKHADDTKVLEAAFSAEVTKVNASIEQLKMDYAAADAALKTELEKQINANSDKLATLETKHSEDIKALDEAYKAADAELKSQILANSTAIAGIQSDIKKINEETIPAARKHAEDLVKALEDKTAETYATKAALTDSTAKVVKLVNAEVVKLTARLEAAEGRLTSLEAAQKALEESLKDAKESYDAQIKAINADIKANKDAIAALKTANAAEVKALKDTLTKLDARLTAAAAAAAAAQKTADEAVAAAAAAQKTANEAVAAAADAHQAANAAQKTATEALGKVNALTEALGVYAQKDSLKVRIEQMLYEELRLTAKTNELAAKDVELSGDIKDLDAKADSLSKAASARIDSVITAFTAKVAELAAADKNMGEDITKLFNEKFDKTAFAGEFKTAYEARFGNDFKAAYEARFSDDFEAAFSTAWAEKFQPSFDTAFETAWKENFQTSFDTALDAVWDSKFKSSFDTNISSYIATALAVDGVIYNKIDELVGDARTALEQKIADAKANLEQQIADAKTALETAMTTDKAALEQKITTAENTLRGLITAEEKARKDGDDALQVQIDTLNAVVGRLQNAVKTDSESLGKSIKELSEKVTLEVERIDKALEEIGLVLGDITNNRIQSIVFVPEYADMNATLYNYNVGGHSLSDTLTVKATFEVYPKALATKVAQEDASVVAVKVDSRASVAVEGNIVGFEAGEDGRIDVTVNFDRKKIGLKDGATDAGEVPFAISLRVIDNVSKTVGKTEETAGTTYQTGNYVESAYVGVKLSSDCDLKDKFVVYKPGKPEKALEAWETVAKKDKDTLGVVIGSAQDLTKEMPWSAENSAWNPFEGYDFYLNLGTDKEPAYFTLAEAAKKLNINAADLNVKLENSPTLYANDNSKNDKLEFFTFAKKNMANTLAGLTTDMVKSKVIKDGVAVDAAIGSHCDEEAYAYIGKDKVKIFETETRYKIVNRKATITLPAYTVDWTYENAVKLSTATTPAGAYKKPIDEKFDKNLRELKAEIVYNDPNTVKDLDLDGILKPDPTKAVVSCDGKEVKDGPSLSAKMTAYVNYSIANVSISGYGGFFTGKTYEIVNTYNAGSHTDVEVKMALTLGMRPQDKEIDLGNVQLDFAPAEKRYNKLPVDPVEKVFENVDQEAFDSKVEKLHEALAAWSEYGVPDAKSYNKDWFNNCVKLASRTNAKPAVDLRTTSGWTFLVPFDATKKYEKLESYVRVTGNDVTSFDDTYAFKTVLKTWYGPVYTFNATGSINKPDYSIGFYEDKVAVTADGNRAKVDGIFDANKRYRITNDDLSKYFRVVAGNGEDLTEEIADNDYLEVTYTVMTKKNVKIGYDAIPVVDSVKRHGVTKVGSIAEEKIDWGDYTSRDLVIKATLYYGNAKLDSKEVTLWSKDPVSFGIIGNPENGVIEKVRKPNETLTVDVWRELLVTSIMEPEVENLVHTTAKTYQGIWYNSEAGLPLAPAGHNKYNVVLKFELDRNQILVNGKVDPLSTDKVSLDAETGTLTYYADAANQANDVVIPVKVTLSHYYNWYLGKNDNHEVIVRIKVPKSE